MTTKYLKSLFRGYWLWLVAILVVAIPLILIAAQPVSTKIILTTLLIYSIGLAVALMKCRTAAEVIDSLQDILMMQILETESSAKAIKLSLDVIKGILSITFPKEVSEYTVQFNLSRKEDIQNRIKWKAIPTPPAEVVDKTMTMILPDIEDGFNLLIQIFDGDDSIVLLPLPGKYRQS